MKLITKRAIGLFYATAIEDITKPDLVLLFVVYARKPDGYLGVVSKVYRSPALQQFHDFGEEYRGSDLRAIREEMHQRGHRAVGFFIINGPLFISRIRQRKYDLTEKIL